MVLQNNAATDIVSAFQRLTWIVMDITIYAIARGSSNKKIKHFTVMQTKSKKLQRKSTRRAILAGLITISTLTVAAACYYLPKISLKSHPDELAAIVQTTDGEQIDVPGNRRTAFRVPGGVLQSDGQQLSVIPMGQLFDSALQSLRVPLKRTYRVKLANGTEMTLDADTRLQFPMQPQGDSLNIHLEGEGYIQVGGNNGSPVTIQTNSGKLQASNAAFNLNTYGNAPTVVSVVKGQVKFVRRDSIVIIGQGKEYLVEGVSGGRLRSVEERTATAWMKGYYSFSRKDFSYIARLIERVFGVPVVIKDPQLARQIMSGSIDKNKPLDENLRNLQHIVNFSYKMADDTLFIREK